MQSYKHEEENKPVKMAGGKVGTIWMLDGAAELLSQCQKTPNIEFLVMREEKIAYGLIC